VNAVRGLLERLALYAFHVLVVRPLLLGFAGVRYRRRNLVPDGPCVVVSNHNSHLDAAVLMGLFPLRRLARVHPVAAADYFEANWFKRTVSMLLMNAVPFERHLTRSQDSLARIVERLRAGERLIFFPEGSRGDPGIVSRFRPGIGRLVQEVEGLQVVPVFLAGPERIWPRGRVVPVPLRIECVVGRPRTYAADADPRAIADQVRDDVLALAPPLPPPPGQRPRPPLRVAVCGARVPGRAELVRALAARLDGEVADGSAPVELAARIARPGRSGSDEPNLHHVLQYLTGERRVPLARWWKLGRTAPGAWWACVLGTAREPLPDCVVWLAGAGGPDLDTEGYRRVVEALRRRRVTALEVDLSRVDRDTAVRNVAEACLALSGAELHSTP